MALDQGSRLLLWESWMVASNPQLWLGPESGEFTAHSPQWGGWLVGPNQITSSNSVWFGNMQNWQYEYLQTSYRPCIGRKDLLGAEGLPGHPQPLALWKWCLLFSGLRGMGTGEGNNLLCPFLSELLNSWAISIYVKSSQRSDLKIRVRSPFITLFNKCLLSTYYVPGTVGMGNTR